MVKQVSNRDTHKFVAKREPFQNRRHTLYSVTLHHRGMYVVYSYGTHWPLYVHDGRQWYGNSTSNSMSTNRHARRAAPTGEEIPLPVEAMRVLVDGGIEAVREAAIAGKFTTSVCKKITNQATMPTWRRNWRKALAAMRVTAAVVGDTIRPPVYEPYSDFALMIASAVMQERYGFLAECVSRFGLPYMLAFYERHRARIYEKAGVQHQEWSDEPVPLPECIFQTQALAA